MASNAVCHEADLDGTVSDNPGGQINGRQETRPNDTEQYAKEALPEPEQDLAQHLKEVLQIGKSNAKKAQQEMAEAEPEQSTVGEQQQQQGFRQSKLKRQKQRGQPQNRQNGARHVNQRVLQQDEAERQDQQQGRKDTRRSAMNDPSLVQNRRSDLRSNGRQFTQDSGSQGAWAPQNRPSPDSEEGKLSTATGGQPAWAAGPPRQLMKDLRKQSTATSGATSNNDYPVLPKNNQTPPEEQGAAAQTGNGDPLPGGSQQAQGGAKPKQLNKNTQKKNKQTQSGANKPGSNGQQTYHERSDTHEPRPEAARPQGLQSEAYRQMQVNANHPSTSVPQAPMLKMNKDRRNHNDNGRQLSPHNGSGSTTPTNGLTVPVEEAKPSTQRFAAFPDPTASQSRPWVPVFDPSKPPPNFNPDTHTFTNDCTSMQTHDANISRFNPQAPTSGTAQVRAQHYNIKNVQNLNFYEGHQPASSNLNRSHINGSQRRAPTQTNGGSGRTNGFPHVSQASQVSRGGANYNGTQQPPQTPQNNVGLNRVNGPYQLAFTVPVDSANHQVAHDYPAAYGNAQPAHFLPASGGPGQGSGYSQAGGLVYINNSLSPDSGMENVETSPKEVGPRQHSQMSQPRNVGRLSSAMVNQLPIPNAALLTGYPFMRGLPYMAPMPVAMPANFNGIPQPVTYIPSAQASTMPSQPSLPINAGTTAPINGLPHPPQMLPAQSVYGHVSGLHHSPLFPTVPFNGLSNPPQFPAGISAAPTNGTPTNGLPNVPQMSTSQGSQTSPASATSTPPSTAQRDANGCIMAPDGLYYNPESYATWIAAGGRPTRQLAYMLPPTPIDE